MELFKIIKKRRSIRKYKSKPVPNDLIEKLVEAALWAPSGSNIHPFRFIVVNDEETINFLKTISPGWLGESPTCIVITSDQKEALEKGGELGKEILTLMDTGFAAQNILLLAHKFGLGACPIRSFSAEAVKEILDLPEKLEPELIISLGYPAESPSPPPRPSVREVTFLNKYQQKFP